MTECKSEIEFIEPELRDADYREFTNTTPCDYPDENGQHHCSYNAQGSDACRNYCGLGVDE